jgi:protein TonB
MLTGLPDIVCGQASSSQPLHPHECILPIEIEPCFKGGQQAWLRFLLKNLRVPDCCSAEEMSTPILVEFVVFKSGSLGKIKIVKGAPCLKDELIRVIKLSGGQWHPGKINGRFADCYRKMPLIIHPETQ